MMVTEGGFTRDTSRLRTTCERLRACCELNEKLLRAATLDEAIPLLVSHVTEALGGTGGALIRGSPSACARSEEYVTADSPWHKLPDSVKIRIIETLTRDRRPFLIPDAAQALGSASFPDGPPFRNLAGLTLMVEGDWTGVLLIFDFPEPPDAAAYAEEAAMLAAVLSRMIGHLQAHEAQARETRFLDTILENSTNPVAYFDTDFNVVRANSAAAAAVRLPREQIIGRHIREFFPESEFEKFTQVRETGEPVAGRETPSPLAGAGDHPNRYWDWSLVPVKDERGEVEGLVLSATDVTEQMETRERMVAAERTKTHVAAALAQEINHRMKNNIFLLTGLLGKQKDKLPGDSYAAEVLQIAVTRLLTIATVHEQLYQRKGEALDVLDAVRQIAQAAKHGLSRDQVQVAVTGTPVQYGPQPGSAICVIANELITNAIKHGRPVPGGDLQIEIDVRYDGDEFGLSVWNSGNPVPPDFDMEARGMSGLSIIDALAVRQYGGAFVLRAERGGTLAEVTLSDSKLRD